MEAISIQDVGVSFGHKEVLHHIGWTIQRGEIATLIGPNGCGKSTLLKVMTKNLKPTSGVVYMGDEPLDSVSSIALARRIAFLPQFPNLPKDIIVEELVSCGRFPYQSWWKNTAKEDRKAIDQALISTKTDMLKDRLVTSLSGGERQRVWIAMALAQEPQILILDEPTTYLDINHQLEVLELLKQLNETSNLTVIMVLHELNQAAAYSHNIAVMQEGRINRVGTPIEVFTETMLEKVFSVRASVEVWNNRKPYIKIKGLL